MNIFVIDSDNNITVFGSGEELPETAGTGKFKSREELGQLAETCRSHLEGRAELEARRCARSGSRCG
jgi:hypothetical protein